MFTNMKTCWWSVMDKNGCCFLDDFLTCRFWGEHEDLSLNFRLNFGFLLGWFWGWTWRPGINLVVSGWDSFFLAGQFGWDGFLCWDMLGYDGICWDMRGLCLRDFGEETCKKGWTWRPRTFGWYFFHIIFRGQSGTCEVCLFFVWLSNIVCRNSSVWK